MTDIPPPTEPGWYADATGAWWWWDGRGWTPQVGADAAAGLPASADQARSQERTMAMIMWIVYLVGGGFIAAIVFYVIAKREKLFVRHHSAEALNLTIALLVPQVLGMVLAAPAYIDWVSSSIDDPSAGFDPTAAFWGGVALLLLGTLASYALSIAGLVQASRGRWWRLPIVVHPVRGAVRRGEEPYSVT